LKTAEGVRDTLTDSQQLGQSNDSIKLEYKNCSYSNTCTNLFTIGKPDECGITSDSMLAASLRMLCTINLNNGLEMYKFTRYFMSVFCY